MNAMALVMTITRVKTLAIRNTAKNYVRYQWIAMKGSRKTRTVLYISQDQKKLAKSQTSSPMDGTNFEEVLMEKIEQRNWTLLRAIM